MGRDVLSGAHLRPSGVPRPPTTVLGAQLSAEKAQGPSNGQGLGPIFISSWPLTTPAPAPRQGQVSAPFPKGPPWLSDLRCPSFPLLSQPSIPPAGPGQPPCSPRCLPGSPVPRLLTEADCAGARRDPGPPPPPLSLWLGKPRSLTHGVLGGMAGGCLSMCPQGLA